MTHEQEEEREALLETRVKGKRDDDRIERDEETVKRFLRGGFRGSLGGQLLTDDEHEVVCAHINYLAKEVAALRDGNEYILVRELREQVECLTQQLEAAYLEMRKQRPAIKAVFDREVWAALPDSEVTE